MNKRILLVAASVVLALFGAIAVYSYAHHADQRAVADTKGRTVLVATQRVPAGTSWSDAVKKHYLSTEKMPADSTPSSALTGMTDAAIGSDAVAQSDIAAGQVVLREAFGTKTSQTGVLSIPKGMLAVTVALNSDANVAGFVGPGAEVAIFVTAKITTKTASTGSSAGDDPSITRTLVSKVAVLATSSATTDAVTGSQNSASNSQGSVLVTLALTQQDAQRVIEGQHVGALYLGLLSASSTVNANDPGVSNAAALAPTPIFVK